jgi:DNA-binding NarL/FixJ family response regulator
MQMHATILVADDHEVVRQGVRAVLQTRPEWEICGEAVDGREAVRLAQELRPDVIIMDITMPKTSGLEASQEIAKLQLPSRVLIYTMHDSHSLAGAVRKAGAHGYVAKSRGARDLVEALELLIAGGTFFGRSSPSGKNETEDPNPNILLRQGVRFAW